MYRDNGMTRGWRTLKIVIIHPNMITYDVRQEKSDKDYGSCLWAKFVFDCDSGRLNINSDSGDYAYRWGHDDREEFMHLMSRIDKDYLLNKISDRSVFNEEKSKKENIKYIKEHGIPYGIVKDGKRITKIVNEIKDIEENDTAKRQAIQRPVFLRFIRFIICKNKGVAAGPDFCLILRSAQNPQRHACTADR